MGRKTKIDWCDASWNPVTGCLHGCEYCYARRIATRFGKHQTGVKEAVISGLAYDLDLEWVELKERDPESPYPYDFKPTFHKYRLTEPQEWKKPKNIFVCSMADLFGDWVPDDCIDQVLTACLAAPQHRYLFLTKNGKRYLDLAKKNILIGGENFWYGCTVTRPDESFFFSDEFNTFASIEPILEPFDWKPGVDRDCDPKWIITGAETGNRKNKVIPEKDWVDGIIKGCEEHEIPLFMKESLRGIMGEDFRQEFPW